MVRRQAVEFQVAGQIVGQPVGTTGFGAERLEPGRRLGDNARVEAAAGRGDQGNDRFHGNFHPGTVERKAR